MDKQNTADYKQVLAEISKTRDVLTELDEFFRKADENISCDPDDEREGIGCFPGFDRLIFLIPCVINRLEEDMSKRQEGENVAAIIECLSAIQDGIHSVLSYYLQDDVEGAINLLRDVLSKIDKLSVKKSPSCIRVFRDIVRIAPDFKIIFDMLEVFRENERTRPKEPEINTLWSPECWLDYYREQARLEEPLVAVVDAEGLSETSLEKGMKRMMEECAQRDKMMEKQLNTYKLMRNREAAFSPEHPEKFLDLSDIPDIKDEDDNDDYEVSARELCYEEAEEEPPEPWATSLPELRDWNKITPESSFDDSELCHHNFEDDPVYLLLNPFVLNLFECLKQNDQDKEGKRGESEMRSPLDHYLIILGLNAQTQIASCGVRAENVGHEAPRKGTYLFVMECLERIAEAAEKFPRKHLCHLATEARNIKKQVNKILTGNM